MPLGIAGAAVDALDPALVARYCDLLRCWDRAVYLDDFPDAQTHRASIEEFISGLPETAQIALEDGCVLLPGWTWQRQRTLRDRWHALQVHKGSWLGWCESLEGQGGGSSGSGAAPAPACASPHAAGLPGGPCSREALLVAARDLVFRQAPDPEQRVALWAFCAGGAAAEGAGSPVAQEGPQHEEAQTPREVKARQEVLSDVERTPNLQEGQGAELLRIIMLYCRRQSGGLRSHYVQGMHMLAACPLWAGLSGAAALSVFEFVLGSVCPGYYQDARFAAFQRDVRVTEVLIAERMPQLAGALKAAGVSTMILTFDSFLCLFTRSMPPKSVLRLWDALLLERDGAVFAVLLALLEGLVSDIQATGGPGPPGRGGSVLWDNFPFADRLRERAAQAGAEELLRRAQDILGAQLRDRVQELRLSVPDDADSPLALGSPAGGRPEAGPPGGGYHERAGALGLRAEFAARRSGSWLDRTLETFEEWLRDGEDEAFRQAAGELDGPHPVRFSGRVRGLGDGGVQSPTSAIAEAERVVGLPPKGAVPALSTLPVKLDVKLPEDYEPGQRVTAAGPHGDIQVVPPAGSAAGSTVQYRLGPRPDFEIRVPSGAAPGTEVAFVREDGVQVSATVPDGVMPGEVFGVLPPAAMVLVPDMSHPGDELYFPVVDGTRGWCRTSVPPGSGPGLYFAARLPPPGRRPSGWGWLDWLPSP